MSLKPSIKRFIIHGDSEDTRSHSVSNQSSVFFSVTFLLEHSLYFGGITSELWIVNTCLPLVVVMSCDADDHPEDHSKCIWSEDYDDDWFPFTLFQLNPWIFFSFFVGFAAPVVDSTEILFLLFIDPTPVMIMTIIMMWWYGSSGSWSPYFSFFFLFTKILLSVRVKERSEFRDGIRVGVWRSWWRSFELCSLLYHHQHDDLECHHHVWCIH